MPPSSPAVSGESSVSVNLFCPTTTMLAALDLGDPLAVRLDQPGLHVGDRLDGAALLLDRLHLGLGALDEFGHQAVHHLRALEDVGVLEQVGLVGEDLLDPQAPLLIPGAGEAERLVPSRQLDRAGTGVAAQGHGKRLEHDPGHVVLGLGLGQAERVDLDAVAEAQELRLGHPVAVAADPLPHLAHGAQLGVLLDEPDPGVDEERDAAEDLGEVLVGDLAARLHLVEHRDRGGERVGDLLDRRRAGLLQVVGADVDRVPLGDLVDGEGDRVGDQPHRGPGREGVGAAREVLLDDVVLGRAGERGALDAVLLRDRRVEREQPGGRGVDRHRGVHLAEWDPVEKRVHVALVDDRDADLADLAASQLRVGVVAGLRGQVEGDREACLALGQVLAVELVRSTGIRVARVGAHDPGAVPLGQAVLAHAHMVSPR